VSLAVVDASVLVAFYTSDDPRRDNAAARLSAGHALFAPAHLDAEVTSALRRLATGNTALGQSVPTALRHLVGFPIRRMPLGPLLERVWQLRDNMSVYDAAYVALAEQTDAIVLTCDAKLTNAPGAACTFDLIA
jgi:predicted nucleic acid-binding protein